MLPYWLLLTVLAIGSLLFRHKQHLAQGGQVSIDHRIRDDPVLAAVLAATTLMIGLRYRVGGDWNVYLLTFRSVALGSLSSALQNTPDEAAYTLINWLVAKLGPGFWAVKSTCAIPFVLGLASICRQQPGSVARASGGNAAVRHCRRNGLHPPSSCGRLHTHRYRWSSTGKVIHLVWRMDSGSNRISHFSNCFHPNHGSISI